MEVGPIMSGIHYYMRGKEYTLRESNNNPYDNIS